MKIDFQISRADCTGPSSLYLKVLSDINEDNLHILPMFLCISTSDISNL